MRTVLAIPSPSLEKERGEALVSRNTVYRLRYKRMGSSFVEVCGEHRVKSNQTSFSTMAHSAFFVILGLTLNPTAIFALLIDPRSPSPVPPAVPNLPSNATTSGNFKVECDGNKYGRDLKPDSCAEVQNQIPTTSQPLRFGPRGRQGVDLATPWRWISCKSLCL